MASYYRESWRVHPARFGVVALVNLAAGVALGAQAGLAAGLHVAVGGAFALIVGACLGALLSRSLPFAHVRNTPLACALGLAVGGSATWAGAVAWLYALTARAGPEGALLCVAPDALLWALPRITPQGTLGTTWLAPAHHPWIGALVSLALVGMAVYGAWRGGRARVYCEGCEQPADEVVRLVCQPIDDPAAFRGGLESEHYDLLLKLRSGDPRDERYSRLTLEDCTGCETHSYLTIVSVGPKGRTTPVVTRLALWRDVFAELERRIVGEWSQAHTELVDS